MSIGLYLRLDVVGFAYARYIVGSRVNRTAHAGFVLDALEKAIHDRRPMNKGGLIYHSDRASQHLSIKYTEQLAEAGIEPSVGSIDDSYDNALAETINGLYKAEVIHRRGPWRSFESVEFAAFEWVDWFNNRRLLKLIGNIPPADREQNLCAAMDNIPMAVQLKKQVSDNTWAIQPPTFQKSIEKQRPLIPTKYDLSTMAFNRFWPIC